KSSRRIKEEIRRFHKSEKFIGICLANHHAESIFKKSLLVPKVCHCCKIKGIHFVKALEVADQFVGAVLADVVGKVYKEGAALPAEEAFSINFQAYLQKLPIDGSTADSTGEIAADIHR